MLYTFCCLQITLCFFLVKYSRTMFFQCSRNPPSFCSNIKSLIQLGPDGFSRISAITCWAWQICTQAWWRRTVVTGPRSLEKSTANQVVTGFFIVFLSSKKGVPSIWLFPSFPSNGCFEQPELRGFFVDAVLQICYRLQITTDFPGYLFC